MKRWIVIISRLMMLFLMCPLYAETNYPIPTGYDFIIDAAGYIIQRQFEYVMGSSVVRNTSSGCYVNVTFNNISTDVLPGERHSIRLISQVYVTQTTPAGSVMQKATLIIRGDLSIEPANDGNLQVVITAQPQTLVVTSDPHAVGFAEQWITTLTPEIAQRFTFHLPLLVLNPMASSRPSGSPPVQVAAYPLGFTWVLQVYAPQNQDTSPPPRIFLLGDTFTMALSPQMIQWLVNRGVAYGRIRSLNDKGLIDPAGPIKVQSAQLTNDKNMLVLTMNGINTAGQPVTVVWRLEFIQSTSGTVLGMNSVTVNGVQQALSPDESTINLQAMISQMTPPPTGWVLGGPLGILRVDLAEVTPNGILLAGTS